MSIERLEGWLVNREVRGLACQSRGPGFESTFRNWGNFVHLTLPQFTQLYKGVPGIRQWWDSSDAIARMNSFQPAVATWLDVSIEVEILFA